MPIIKRIYPYLFVFLLTAMLYVPSLSQESTEAPIAPEIPTEIPIVTESPTEAPIIIETPLITESPTEAPIVTESPTEAPLITELPSASPSVEITETTIITQTLSAEITETAQAESTETLIITETPSAEVTEATSQTPLGSSNEMLLQYNPSASEDSIQAMLLALGAVELERLPQLAVLRVSLPAAVSSLSSAQTVLQGSRGTNTAGLLNFEPNQLGYINLEPNDPEFLLNQVYLQDAVSVSSINMTSAWDISPRDGLGVIVAVLDTGLDLQHPEFAGRFVAGWNFYAGNNNPDDDNGHGTHVSGVIAARTNNGIGIAGMAFNSRIMPLKVCNADGICPIYDTAAAIIYAVDRGAKVINLSLGYFSASTILQGAVNYALARNVTVVAAAGNYGDGNSASNEFLYPAAYVGVISVASMNSDGTIYPTSNSNSNVTVAAQGAAILSTWPLNLASSYAIGYEYETGTSMAAPHVAALAALLIADGVATTPAQIRQNLLCTSINLGAVGYDNSFGYGLIQADLALRWTSNSNSCQVSLANDLIQNAINITTLSYSIVQPVSTRSVTESSDDPTIGGIIANQTLWYKFTPRISGQFMFSTFGSGSQDTLLGVYEGQPGSLREIASNNDLGIPAGPAQLRVSLIRGITYYILVGTNGTDALNQYIQLNLNPAVTARTIQQENIPAIRYSGTWNRSPINGASGGYASTTTDTSATASFLVRGTNLSYRRMVGPTQGTVEFFIDGNSTLINNVSAVEGSVTSSIPLGTTTGEWHLVSLRWSSGLPSLNLDAFQVFDGTLPTAIVGNSRQNETASAFVNAFSANDTWLDAINPLAFARNLRYTSDTNAFVQFRTSGSAITFWRSTGSGTGMLEIWLDNEYFGQIDNSLYPSHPSVPYSIANLAPRERVVRLVHLGPDDFLFDGAQSVMQTLLRVNTITDERSTSLLYSGIWTRTSVTSTLAYGRTLSTIASSANGGNVQFMFSGNHFCIGYQKNSSGGLVDIIVDGGIIDQIDTNNLTTLSKIEWCSYNEGFNRLSDTLHRVRLEVAAGEGFTFDYVRPVRRIVFTSAMGYIAENNANFLYTGAWTSSNLVSTGRMKFQGGSARQANVSAGGGQSVSFTINGTGFILYTAIDADGIAGAYEVYLDGNLSPLVFTYNGGSVNYLDLFDYRSYNPNDPNYLSFRPVGIGILDAVALPVGIHHIRMVAIEPYPALRVHFDGIRVIP